MKYTFLTLLIAIGLSANAAEKQLQTVRIDFLEALAPRDTTSSEEFRRQFESSVALGIKLTEAAMRTCGYRFNQKTEFYSASDTLQAQEKAKEVQISGSWLVVGPRRSDHYVLVSKGANSTPSVSLMASSSEVEELGPLHLSVYPTNSNLAPALAKYAKANLKKTQAPTYLTVLSEDCLNCRDFSGQFDASAKKSGLKKLDEIKVITDTPDTAPVVDAVLKHKPTFVILPNYSKVSSQVMASIQSKAPSTFFLGGDGWGDGQFGFVDRNPSISTASGMAVRGFPPVDIGLRSFSLGRRALDLQVTGSFVPKSGPGVAILKIIEGAQELLCQARPKTASDFRKAFERSGRKYFSAPWGVSLFELSDARIRYLREAKPSKMRGNSK